MKASNGCGAILILAAIFVLLGVTACGPQTDVPLLMKITADQGRADPGLPDDVIQKLPPELQKALAEKRPADAITLQVFWKKGFRAPYNTGERKLICSDGSEVSARPINLNVVFHSSVETGGKPTGEEYSAMTFWVPSHVTPVAVQIAGSKFPLRWATNEEANRLTGGR
jgi:hypothetical protein